MNLSSRTILLPAIALLVGAGVSKQQQALRTLKTHLTTK